MEKLRKYGKEPFTLSVIHGGPGAAGEMAPVARELSSNTGVLEPFQTALTIEGQIEELKNVFENTGSLPLTLIGWSWGAWLSFLFASQFPLFVKKLILIGSGPFEVKYARDIMKTRLRRMNEQDKKEILSMTEALEANITKEKNTLLARFGKLISKADAYDPLPHDDDVLECRHDIYHSVWEQADRMRKDGRLLEFGKKIRCPVFAIHGDHDPHPADGIQKPLSRTLKDFRFILLDKCGHKPWIERHAKKTFYGILKNEID
jgi:pimeloyl-ACP methyl ester carboxylesterase